MEETIDPITLEVIHHRLTSIADEMEMALVKSAFSIIVKEGRDCSSALFDAKGQTIAQSQSIPVHLGTLMMSVPQILGELPPAEMHDGDVFLVNDPYSGGTHIPDVTVAVPVLYEGEVVALCCSMTHHQDFGAMTPGVPTSATSLYQEGLNLPPLKFYDQGRPVKVVHDIIRNNVRTPEVVIGDLRAQVAAGNVGKLRIRELCGEYGKDMVLAAFEQLQDHSEALTRLELERIPDGSYGFVDYLDNDGVDIYRRVRIQAAVTLTGSEFAVDFTGTDSQVQGPFNVTPAGAWAAAAFVVRAITGAAIPTNAGCFRPITLTLPEGSLVNPRSPAPVGARAVVIDRIADTLLGALVRAVPERLTACSGNMTPVIYFGGIDPGNGREYVTNELGVGGLGARPAKDGIDTIWTNMSTGHNIPVEAFEASCPVRVVRAGLHDDSGGSGEYRGGLGLVKVFEVLSGTVSATHRGERFFTQPWGLFGGDPGKSARSYVVRRTGETEEVPAKRDLVLHAGDRLHVFSQGGGGYGDPLKRPQELVLRDVRDRRVSRASAAADYGVVIDPERLDVDVEKTEAMRAAKVSERGPITWTYDRGGDAGRE